MEDAQGACHEAEERGKAIGGRENDPGGEWLPTGTD